MNPKEKRQRINKVALQEVEVIDETVENVETTGTEEIVDYYNDMAEWYNEDGSFKWDEYEATCPSVTRKPNPHIKARKGDIVYCRASYAQELYDLMNESSLMSNIKATVAEGEIHEGTVYAINNSWITVDIGYRELIYVKFDREPDYVQALSVNDETAVLITHLKPNSHIMGTISGGVKQKVFADLRQGVEDGDTAWVGKISSMIEGGGYIVRVQGIDCFMPGSLAGINKLHDFESIIGQELYVVPVSFSAERGTIVVSHRKYLQALIPNAIADLRENVDQEYTGQVTGTAKYGVFVEFNQCLTGMIHANDLDEETMKVFKSRSINPGDSVTFKVKDIISNTKITLTQKINDSVNPWLTITQRYQIPSNVEAVVKSKKEYGLFITIEEGVTGLLHISEIGEDVMKTFNPGDAITVQITRIEAETNKVFLKLPE
jgi:small subunit ribosomal protein S1